MTLVAQLSKNTSLTMQKKVATFRSIICVVSFPRWCLYMSNLCKSLLCWFSLLCHLYYDLHLLQSCTLLFLSVYFSLLCISKALILQWMVVIQKFDLDKNGITRPPFFKSPKCVTLARPWRSVIWSGCFKQVMGVFMVGFRQVYQIVYQVIRCK
jgi:hypothetical protein